MAVQPLNPYEKMGWWRAARLFFADAVNMTHSIRFAGAVARKVYLVLTGVVLTDDAFIAAAIAAIAATGPIGAIIAAALTVNDAIAVAFVPIALGNIIKIRWTHNKRRKKLIRW